MCCVYDLLINVLWVWLFVLMIGYIIIVYNSIGIFYLKYIRGGDEEIMWFVELRLWLRVFIIFSIGIVIYGFKVNLIIVLKCGYFFCLVVYEE